MGRQLYITRAALLKKPLRGRICFEKVLVISRKVISKIKNVINLVRNLVKSTNKEYLLN